MKSKKVIAFGAILGTAAIGCLAFAVPASADPVSNSYVLAGSDTLQDSTNALINGTGITTSNVRVLAAFGSASIQTKPGGVYFARPAGSGDGVHALQASIDGTSFSISGNSTPAVPIPGAVDIARSSGGPTNPNASGRLAFVPYGRDAVSYAYKGGSAALASIPTADLKLIYQCDATTLAAYGTPTPVLPQTSSGTRKFFLTAIGSPALGSCVVNGVRAGDAVQENDGSQINANEIIPFSVASYYAQSTNVAQNRTNGSTLGTPLGATTPLSAGAPNPAYYSDTHWGRDTYLVVEFARLATDPGLAALVDPTKAKSLTNFSSGNATAGAVKAKYGFLAPSSTTVIRAADQ